MKGNQLNQSEFDDIIRSYSGAQINTATIVLSSMYNGVESHCLNRDSKNFYFESKVSFNMRKLFRLLSKATVNQLSMSIHASDASISNNIIKALSRYNLPKNLNIIFTGVFSKYITYTLYSMLYEANNIESFDMNIESHTTIPSMFNIDNAIKSNDRILHASYTNMSEDVKRIIELRKCDMNKAKKMRKAVRFSETALQIPCPLFDSFQLNFGCTVSDNFQFADSYTRGHREHIKYDYMDCSF